MTYETEARAIKARKLADAFRALVEQTHKDNGREVPTAAEVLAASAHLGDGDWRLLAAVQGIRPPSTATQHEAVRCLEAAVTAAQKAPEVLARLSAHQAAFVPSEGQRRRLEAAQYEEEDRMADAYEHNVLKL